MKRMAIFAVLIIFIMAFSGCDFSVSMPNNLLSAPKLTVEQKDIYNALVKSVGKDIQLIYPETGDNRSAYLIKNLDNEETNEALVFYRNIGEISENNVRINVLNQIDGEWVSTYDASEEGVGIYEVVTEKLSGDSDEISIAVGIKKTTGDKNLCIFSYSNNILVRSYRTGYVDLDTIDFDKSDNNSSELVLTKYEREKASISVMNIFSSTDKTLYEMDIAKGVKQIVSMEKGMLFDDTTALFIDELKNDNTIETEVIAYQDGMFLEIKVEDETTLTTLRANGYYSQDFDNDGQIEIPITKIQTGYDENTNSVEVKYITDWYNFNEDFELSFKNSSFYNIDKGYIITFPKKWEREIFITKDTTNNEMVISSKKVDGKQGDELLRIATTNRDGVDNMETKGYITIRANDETCYMAKIMDSDNVLSITKDELLRNFYLKN